MKKPILVAVVVTAVSGLATLGFAQGNKKLQYHPDAAKDKAVADSRVDAPKDAADGKASATVTKPITGDAVASGGTSTDKAKKQ